MPYALELPPPMKAQGWKVKIYDKERLEPPHVTIMHKKKAWRLGLRDGEFLVPPGGSWRDIPDGVRAAIRESWELICGEWDRKYPTNPVSGKDEATTDERNASAQTGTTGAQDGEPAEAPRRSGS